MHRLLNPDVNTTVTVLRDAAATRSVRHSSVHLQCAHNVTRERAASFFRVVCALGRTSVANIFAECGESPI